MGEFFWQWMQNLKEDIRMRPMGFSFRTTHPNVTAGLDHSGKAAGNLGRNVFRKDGIQNINVALSRNWRVAAEKTLTFRAESINFFNTPQFDRPGGSLTGDEFGQINNTLNDGRAYRFLLQFGF